MAADYARRQASRIDFNKGLRQNERTAVEQKWQRTYLQGSDANATAVNHVTRRPLKAPVSG